MGFAQVSQGISTAPSVNDIRDEAEARRQKVFKAIQDEDERIRVWRLAKLKEATVANRKSQDDMTRLIRRDRFDSLDAERASVSETVHRWLNGLRKGRPQSCWYAGTEPLRLYAVQDYEIVDWLGQEQCVVRIHSSTADGQPIVRLYRVTVRGLWITGAEPQ